MKDVQNCPKCGKIFVKALRPICQQCFQEQEKNYETVSRFMRRKQNRMASIREVHEKTEVPITQIHQFVREGRLLVTHFPNLGYPCESCETIITEGRICATCTSNIKSGLDKIDKEKEFEQRKDEERRKERSAGATYHSLNDRFDKK
ncbi:flagellar protein [Halalkalibacter wakoensis JCM 9140]|uniref:Flagellar protein n=1 Tax=Halalkalibacter wakoensis JCM 9140 TaxID=1236970 RepID=W4Q484_9BACI|nr:TIGR03826 family flagellar region protein [Halalkalibacter wakoensis]GAE26508.1 flagellar protein [Halalkalibacter wakoensis JCM 9140]